MAASANPILADKAVRDPTLFCAGLKRQRFYMFTRSEPEYVDDPLRSSPFACFLAAKTHRFF
jgi:peptidylprolyl isomerase domain and WD repeat-containing protein 1